MTSKSIYLSALRLIAESTADSDNEDYADRACYILAAFCTNVHEINNALRRAKGLDELPVSEKVLIGLDEDFPCMPRLASAAAHYLGAMLIADSFPELSDKLFDKYCDLLARLTDRIPATPESISDIYLFD